MSHVGDNNQTESLSFEAKIDGNTGHLNYNNEIQGIVSVVGDKEVRVRFSTGPLANAMLNFKVQDGSVDDYSNENYEVVQNRETASRENVSEEKVESNEKVVSEISEEEYNNNRNTDLNEVGYEF